MSQILNDEVLSRYFIENKYFRWYLKLVSRSSLASFVERHHILPRSLGGSDDISNLVRLTPRQHFVSHLLLAHCTKNDAKYKMIFALHLLQGSKRKSKIKITAKRYEVIKKLQREAKMPLSHRLAIKQSRLGKKASEEHKKNISIANKGKKRSEKTKKKISEGLKGKRLSNEHKCSISSTLKKYFSIEENVVKFSQSLRESWSQERREKVSKRMKGRRMSLAHRQKMSEARKGKKFSKEHREAIRQARLGKKFDKISGKMIDHELFRIKEVI